MHIITYAYDSRGSKAFTRLCLSVCQRDNSKMNNPNVFKLGIGNNLGISYKCYDFGVERSKVKVTGSQSAKRIEGDRVAGVSYGRVPSL